MKILLLLTLLLSFNTYAATGISSGGGVALAQFDINLGGNGFSSGGFNRASNIVEVYGGVTNIASRGSTFRYASGTAYIIPASPSKATLLGIECVCGSSNGTDTRIAIFAGDTTRTDAVLAGQDIFLGGTMGAQNGHLLSYDETSLKASGGKCAVSKMMNLDLTANFRGQGRDRFGIYNSSNTFLRCTAWIKEE